MAKFSSSSSSGSSSGSSTSNSTKKNKKSGGGIIGRLQKSLLPNKTSDDSSTYYVPKDVKQGHFAVLVVDDEEPKRFVVPLTYLSNPAFLRLLEQAAEEYGFDHGGALTIPCRPSELEMILEEQHSEGIVSFNLMCND